MSLESVATRLRAPSRRQTCSCSGLRQYTRPTASVNLLPRQRTRVAAPEQRWRREMPQSRHLQTSSKIRRVHQLTCRAEVAPPKSVVPAGSVSLVLLAGGVGKRMGASIPKQYLELFGQPIATYSLQTFASMPEVGEVVVVCEKEYRSVFEEAMHNMPDTRVPLSFAQPGKERQDSVKSGFEAISSEAKLVAIHDSARPLVTAEDSARCMAEAWQVVARAAIHKAHTHAIVFCIDPEVGAAVLGVAVKPTIKEVDADGFVVKTLHRAALVEVQTPQVIQPALLKAGFQLVGEQCLEVTDDVSIIEALGKPVKITMGAYSNIKVTTPDDMSVAEGFLKDHHKGAVVHA